jgi:hypothetical protein
MRIFLKNLQDGLFMNTASQWGPKDEAYDFKSPSFAIDFCVMHKLRSVGIIIDSGDPARDIFLEVHGAERAALLEAIKKSGQLQEQQRILGAELDSLGAEGKERRKRLPFKRKSASTDEAPPGQ